jgi:HAL2 family 3'(2'),5'-bisphosphate nucleotidase
MIADSKLIDAARKAVLLAARVTRAVHRNSGAVRTITKDDRSPVTVADYASQAIVCATLRDTLTDAFSAVPIIAEEEGALLRQPAHAAHCSATLEAVREVRPDITESELLDLIDRAHGGAGGPRFWTLDPIDGTKGFLRGQQYAVALAFVEHGVPVIGALACPNLPRDIQGPLDQADPVGTVYVATKGGGTEEHPGIDSTTAAPRLLPRVPPLEAATIVTCASVEAGHSSVGDTDRLLAHIGADREVRRLDSSAKYAVVARGQADAYIRLPTRKDYVERIWDHAAGVVVATEAGCIVSDMFGRELDFTRGRGLAGNQGVIVARPGAHERIIRGIAELGIGSM